MYSIDPWGEERADQRSAMIAWTIASVNCAKGKKPKFKDFLLDYKSAARQTEKKKEQSSEHMMQTLIAIANQHNERLGADPVTCQPQKT